MAAESLLHGRGIRRVRGEYASQGGGSDDPRVPRVPRPVIRVIRGRRSACSAACGSRPGQSGRASVRRPGTTASGAGGLQPRITLLHGRGIRRVRGVRLAGWWVGCSACSACSAARVPCVPRPVFRVFRGPCSACSAARVPRDPRPAFRVFRGPCFQHWTFSIALKTYSR